MSKVITYLLTLLPVYILDWLLTGFARLQLFILTAKGAILKQQRQNGIAIAKRLKKKLNKPPKTQRLRRASVCATSLGLPRTGGSTMVGATVVHRHPARLFADRRQSEANAGIPCGPSMDMGMGAAPDLGLKKDGQDEDHLFETNEMHRKEFEEFLRSVKDIKDVQNWLKNFSHESGRKIAIVKISRRILETDYGAEQAGTALAYMFKFGLFPIAVHGGFNELTRDTCTEVIERRRSFSSSLKQAIRRAGVGAAILTPDVCSVEAHIDRVASLNDMQAGGGFVSAQTDSKGGLSMRVTNIDHTVFTSYLERGKIPIWDGVATTEVDKAEVPLNGDVTTVELARLLQPYRIIFACNDGGILDKDHKAIPVVYMDKDYTDLMEADWVSERRKIQLFQLRRIVNVVPPSTAVVVTSIENANLQLLYPRVYSETIIKRAQDSVVHVIKNFDDVDKEQLRTLIEDSFGRPLTPDYFELLSNELHRLYLITGMDGEYNGCAVVTEGTTQGYYYLCKFCVRKQAQGLGLGDLLWRCLQRDIKKLYWRSRNSNPLNTWYSARCQGSFRTNEHFTVFWYGDDSFEDGLNLIEDAIKKPVTVLPLTPVQNA